MADDATFRRSQMASCYATASEKADYKALWAEKLKALSPEHFKFVDSKIRAAISQGKGHIVFFGTEGNIIALQNWAVAKNLRTFKPTFDQGGWYSLPGDEWTGRQGKQFYIGIDWQNDDDGKQIFSRIVGRDD